VDVLGSVGESRGRSIDVLSLTWDGIDAFSLRPAWLKAASLPAPRLPALLGRQWRLDRSRLSGSYLFRESGPAAEFLAKPDVDPAYRVVAAKFAACGGRAPRVERDGPAVGLDRPVFIIGVPRSGSTLLFDLLSQAPDLWTQGGEGQGAVEGLAGLHPADRGFESHRLTEEDASDEISTSLEAAWTVGLRDRTGRLCGGDSNGSPKALRFLDKTTEHVLRVSFLAQVRPDARFVFLHREARQNVSSLIEAWRHGGFVKFDDLPDWPDRAWCFLLPPEWRRLRGRPLEEVATAQWAIGNRCALDDLETLDPSRWTSVDYNELVADPKRVILRICAFAGLAVDDRILDVLDRPLRESATTISPPSSLKWRQNRFLDAAKLDDRVRTLSGRLRSLDAPKPAAAVSRERPAAPSSTSSTKRTRRPAKS
jgi:Sulfotransferase family